MFIELCWGENVGGGRAEGTGMRGKRYEALGGL